MGRRVRSALLAAEVSCNSRSPRCWLGEPWRALAGAAFAWGMAASTLHLLHLVRARLRGRVFRALVSVPGQTFIAASFMAGPWQLVLWPVRAALSAAGLEEAVAMARWLDVIPYGVAAISVTTSTRRATTTRHWGHDAELPPRM